MTWKIHHFSLAYRFSSRLFLSLISSNTNSSFRYLFDNWGFDEIPAIVLGIEI